MSCRHLLVLTLWIAPLFLISPSCSPEPTGGQGHLAEQPFSGPSPWPEIRRERIATLLPAAMQKAGVDGWIILCRSNNNDPLALHVGCENAVAPAAFYFERRGDEVYSIVFTPPGEATALQEIALHDSIAVAGPNSPGSLVEAAFHLIRHQPGTIAMNFSSQLEIADGLSYSQHRDFTNLLPEEVRRRVVSSENLVYHWLSVKLPEEVDIMRRAAELTARWQLEAYATVVPGVTTDRDVADFLKARMREAGVGDAWAPDQNPAVNSGPDRGHAHPTSRIIQPGDVIQTDFGIRVYDTWVTDIQRFAYVLHPGETQPPEHIQRFWEVAREGNRRAFRAMRPGVTGFEVDRVQREWMRENGSMEVRWNTGHPVGYVAHDVGPSLGGAQRNRTPHATAFMELQEGNIFAFDGFFMWEIEGGTKTISVEEMAVITENGAAYLIPPQEELVLIPSR